LEGCSGARLSAQKVSIAEAESLQPNEAITTAVSQNIS